MAEKTKMERLQTVLSALTTSAIKLEEELLAAEGNRAIMQVALNPKVGDTYELMEELRVALKLFNPGEISEEVAKPWHVAVCKLIADMKRFFGPFDSLINDETRQHDLYKVIIGRHVRGKSKEEYDKKVDRLIDLLEDDYILNAKAVAMGEGMVPLLEMSAKPKKRGRPKINDRDDIYEMISSFKKLGYTQRESVVKTMKHAKFKSRMSHLLPATWERYYENSLKNSSRAQ